MAKYTIEDIKNYKEMGIINEETASRLIEAIVMAEMGGAKVTSPKKATESKAPKAKLTAEEKEAQKKAKNEAWKAEKKAWAEEHYTEEERKAFKEERDARRADAKKKHLAYCQTNAHFGGKKVSKEEWHKKYEEFLKKAK
jgi:hypothetical protein